MALIGQGLSTSYPSGLDTPQYTFGGASNFLNGSSPIPDSQSRVDAEFMNDVIDAIVAIEAELGINPSGSFSTVAARFTASTITTPGSPNTTDNAVVRWDGTGGNSILNSGVIISDTDDVSGIRDISLTRNILLGAVAAGTSLDNGIVVASGTAPSAAHPVDAIQMWVEDREATAGKGSLHIRTEDGTSHVIGDRVGIGTLTPETLLTVEQATNAAIVRLINGGLQLVKDDGTTTSLNSFDCTAYGGTTTQTGFVIMQNKRARGTIGTPTQTQLGDVFFRILAKGMDDSGSFTPSARTWIDFLGTEIWTTTAHGSAIVFNATTTGTLTQGEITRFVNTNILLGITTHGTSLAKGLVIGSGTAPSGSHPADAVQIWVADQASVAADAALHIRSETGDIYSFGNCFSVGASNPSGNIHFASPSFVANFDRNDDTQTGPQMVYRKSRGTDAAPTVLLANDRLAQISGWGYVRNATDTADAYEDLTLIMFRASDFDAQGRAGGNISFWTSSGVSASVTEKMTLVASGRLGIGLGSLPAPAAYLHVGNDNTTTGQLILGSSRAIIGSNDVLGGVEYWSNDTTLTAPGALSAYIRAVAREIHTTTALGSELTFATTPNTTTTPVAALTIHQDSDVNILVGELQTAGGRVNYNLSAYSSGTVYALTATAALLNFGTTDPSITINVAGTYKISGTVVLNYNGATFAANRTVTLKLRRTNNTPADLTNGTTVVTTGIVTTTTETFVVVELPNIIYTTALTTDIIQIFGDVSVVPSAGSLDAVQANIMAVRLY